MRVNEAIDEKIWPNEYGGFEIGLINLSVQEWILTY